MVKRLLSRPKAAALLLVLAAGGVYAWRRWKRSKPAEGPAVVAVSRGDLENRFVDAGEILPKNGMDVASKVSGRVTELLVAEGQRVRQGQRLCVIQPGRTEAEQFVPASVLAPGDGMVMRYQKSGGYQDDGRIVKLGDYVTGLLDSNSPTYLMTVADLSQLMVRMKISEMDVLKLREDMEVTVTADALPGVKFPGRVALISPKAEKDFNNLKNFKVDIALLKADSRLKPGMTARVDGLLDARRGALKIPLSAVFEEGGKEVAYVRTAETPRRVLLTLGLRNETDAEVLGGVAPGDELLTEKPGKEAKP